MIPSKTWWIGRGVERELRILEKLVRMNMQSLNIAGDLEQGVHFAKTLAMIHKRVERLIQLSTADQN